MKYLIFVPLVPLILAGFILGLTLLGIIIGAVTAYQFLDDIILS